MTAAAARAGTVRDDPLARGLFLDSLAASTALASRMLPGRSETAPAGALLINRVLLAPPIPAIRRPFSDIEGLLSD
jgi:hypothetical protein